MTEVFDDIPKLIRERDEARAVARALMRWYSDAEIAHWQEHHSWLKGAK